MVKHYWLQVNAAAIATPRVKRQLPPRSEQVKTLESGEEYDVLIIGGGATGAGCALDSITRGKQYSIELYLYHSTYQFVFI